MKLLMGYLRCWQGSVRLNGAAIEALDPPARRRLGITYCPQERPVFDDLTVRDNLTLMRADRGLAPFAAYVRALSHPGAAARAACRHAVGR